MRLPTSLFFRCAVFGFALLLFTACSETAAVEVLVSPTEESVQATKLQPKSAPIPAASVESATLTVPPPASTVVSVAGSLQIDLPRMALADVQIGQCRLSGDIAPNGFSGNGTAAAATPTPVPVDGSRHPDLVAMELDELRYALAPISEVLAEHDGMFLVTWPLAVSTEEQAAQLHVLGNRLAQLCSALSQLNIPPEALGQVTGLAESVRVRHRLTEILFDELLCCGDAHTTTMDIGFGSTSKIIAEATLSLSVFLADNTTGSGPDSGGEFFSDHWGMSVSIGTGSMVVRNSVDVLIAFIESPDMNSSSLGPESWFDGSAMRIRRLRNRSQLSIEQAVVEYEGFITKHGEVSRVDSIENLGIDEIHYEYVELGDSWEGSMTAFVWDGYTYFVEAICRKSEPNYCDSIGSSIESISFSR